MQNRKSVSRGNQKRIKNHNTQKWIVKKDLLIKVAFKWQSKASKKKMGEVDMYLKGKANEKDGLIAEAEAEMCFRFFV